MIRKKNRASSNMINIDKNKDIDGYVSNKQQNRSYYILDKEQNKYD